LQCESSDFMSVWTAFIILLLKLASQFSVLHVKDSPSGTLELGLCDVCGSYLSRLDNDQQLVDRFYGKMHLGYAQMRKTYEAFPKELSGRSRPMQDGDSSPAPWRATREAMEMKGMGLERAVTVRGVAEEVVDSEREGEDLEKL
jgi:hypothetical protein